MPRTHVRKPSDLAPGPQPAPALPTDEAAGGAAGGAQQAAGTLDESVHKSATLISACVLLSRITGFFRTWAMAFAMGSTLLASSYQVANNLPMMLYDMVIGGMLVTAFLPVYVSVKKRLGEDGGNEYASNLLTLTVIFVGLVSILCSIFAPQLIFTQSFLSNQDSMETSVFFFRFFAFQILFYSAGSIVSGLLNAHRDFLWSSIAPVFNNIIVIATFVAYALAAPADPELGLWIIAIGNPLGVFVQLAIQLPALRRNGIRIRPRIDLRDPALRETLSIGVPAVVVMVTSFMVVSVQNAAAYSIADNGPSIIAYARLWFTLPYAFLAVPITTAMFTELSEQHAEGDMSAFKRSIVQGTRQILFLTIPFAMFLMVFAYPLVNLYHAGAFTGEHVAGVATYLVFVAISLPFYGVNTYLQKTFSALRQLKRYAVYNIVCTVLQIAFTLLLATQPWPDWHTGMAIIALGDTLFFGVSDLLCALHLHRAYGDFGIRDVLASSLHGLGLGALGALAGAGVLALMNAFIAPYMGNILLSLLYIVVAGSCALLVTFGIAIKLRLPGVQPLVGILDRVLARFKRSGNAG